MPFSVPVVIGERLEYKARISALRDLTQFEYFDNDAKLTPEQQSRERKAAYFRQETEFAFFFVNFGISKRDYLNLTEVEKMFIRKQYENRIVETNTHLRNAVFNAEYNVNRKKHSPFRELFKKKPPKAERAYNRNALQLIEELEARDGKGWVDKVYQANADSISRMKSVNSVKRKEGAADG